MKKLFLFLLVFSSILFAQSPTRPTFPAGNGTNERFFRVGKTAPYFSWSASKKRYYYVDSTIVMGGPSIKDTIWWASTATNDSLFARRDTANKFLGLNWFDGYTKITGKDTAKADFIYAKTVLGRRHLYWRRNDTTAIALDSIGSGGSAIDTSKLAYLAKANSFTKAQSISATVTSSGTGLQSYIASTVVSSNVIKAVSGTATDLGSGATLYGGYFYGHAFGNSAASYGIYASADGSVTGADYAGYFDKGTVYIKNNLQLEGNITKWGNKTIEAIPTTDSTKVLHSNGKWKVATGGIAIDTTKIGYLAKANIWTFPNTFQNQVLFDTTGSFNLPINYGAAGDIYRDGNDFKFINGAMQLKTVALTDQVTYIGTTSVSISRGSGALSLTGVSIDGSATNLAGGSALKVPYQTAANTTGFSVALVANEVLGYWTKPEEGDPSVSGIPFTNANTANTLVKRDASGNFSAGTITATLSGNASTVTNGVYTNASNNFTSSANRFRNALYLGDDSYTTDGELIFDNGTNNLTTTLSAPNTADSSKSITLPNGDGPLALESYVTDANLSFTDITTNNASTSKHGFLPKLNNSATQFLNGQGNWATPTGTGVDLGGNNTWTNINNFNSTLTIPTSSPSPTANSIFISGSDFKWTNGSGDVKTALQVEVDGSTTNEIQTLGTSGNTITLTGGGSVTAPYATTAGTVTNGIYTTSTWTGGDLSGTGLAATVNNDSHDHTSTTISGLSTSDFTSANISQWTNDASYTTLATVLGNANTWTANNQYNAGLLFGATGYLSLPTKPQTTATYIWYRDSRVRYAKGGVGYALVDSTDLAGYTPTSRTLTINGTTLDLSANRSWIVGDAILSSSNSFTASNNRFRNALYLGDDTFTTDGQLIFDNGTNNLTTTLSAPNATGSSKSITLPNANGVVLLSDGSGASLTSLNATNISSGTLADARLSSNVPLEDGANTFSNINTFSYTLKLTNKLTSTPTSNTSLNVTGYNRLYLSPTGAGIVITLTNAVDGQILWVFNASADDTIVVGGYTVDVSKGMILIYDSSYGGWINSSN